LRFAAQKLVDGSGYQAGAAGSERMAQREGAAVGIYVRRVILDAEVTQDRESLRGEGFVYLDDAHFIEREIGFGQHFSRGRSGAHAHDARGDSGGGGGDDARFGSESIAAGGGFRSEQQCAGAVVYTGSVSGGHGSAGFHDGFQ